MSARGSLLVALRGLPGIGKSVLARAVGRELGWAVLDKDDLKDVLAERIEHADELAYDLLFRVAGRLVAQGQSVVCDSPLMHAGLYALADRTAREAGAVLVVLDCTLADAAEHRRRLDARRSNDHTRPWRVNDWPGLVAYRDRTVPGAAYPIDVPRRLLDLGHPHERVAHEAVNWLRDLTRSDERPTDLS